MAHNFLSALTGSFAIPAAENPTVAMIEAAYRHHHIDARYINCEVPPHALGEAVRGAVAMGWLGFNCSLPHKVAVIEHLDELAPSASVIGAVNCVVRRDRTLVGENTDGQGFLASLRTVLDPAGRRFMMFGAGGAARAIAVETAFAGAESITIVNRDPRRGAELVGLLNTRTPAKADLIVWDRTISVPAGVDALVNATSIGLFPDVDARLDLDVSSLTPPMVVADVIPNPPTTQLLRDAAAHGCVTIDGLGMCVNQGVASIELWLGVAVDAAPMRAELERLLRDPQA